MVCTTLGGVAGGRERDHLGAHRDLRTLHRSLLDQGCHADRQCRDRHLHEPSALAVGGEFTAHHAVAVVRKTSNSATSLE